MATSTSKDAKQSLKVKSDPKGRHESNEDTAAAPPRKKRNPLKVLFLAAALLLITGAAAWYVLDDPQPHEEKPRLAKAAPAKAAKVTPAKPPLFVPLEPFTVNLQLEDAAQYLQVGLTLRISDASHGDAIKLYMPDIRNRILLLLTNKKASQLATLDGKQTLATEIVHETAQALGSSVPSGGISGALFTSFVIQ